MSVKLLKDLNFTEIINGTSAVTEAGKDMLNNYRGYVYSNPVNCTVVNNFVLEASKFGFDTGLVSILESVNKFINENNISWKLASACESISNSNNTYGYLAKVGIERVEKLLEMKETDVVSYIKAGALKSIQFIPEFRSICKEVYQTSIVEQHTPAYSIVNPISFILNEGNTQYISVLGKTFAITEGVISEAICNNPTFVKVNSLLESFKSEEDSLIYAYETYMHETIKFVINEDKLTMTKGNKSEEFDSVVKFNEHANMISKVMPINEKMNFMNIVTNIAQVFENINNIVVLDCTKLITTSTGTVCAITEAENNVNLTVFRSYNAGTSCNNYEYVSEALKNVTKIAGLDLRHLYENRINEDCKKQNPSEVEEIEKQLQEAKEVKLEARKRQIAMLAEKHKNDPAKITLLNSLARELSLLD
jgi:hypothetical protein